MDTNLVNNTEQVLYELRLKSQLALSAAGETVEGHAKDTCPVDTGRLRNSITHQNKGHSEVIGSNVEYAPYVEYGTGIYAEEGGRQTPWWYQDEKGQWHKTVGQKPSHFLKNAISNNQSEIKELIDRIMRQ